MAARADVGELDRARRAELALHVDVPVLHPRRLQIALVRGRRLRDEHRERRRERIGERERRQPRIGEVDAQIEVRRVEVEPLRRRQRALVVVDAVAAAQHRARGAGRASTRSRRAARGCCDPARSRRAACCRCRPATSCPVDAIVEIRAIVLVDRRRRCSRSAARRRPSATAATRQSSWAKRLHAVARRFCGLSSRAPPVSTGRPSSRSASALPV